jgi:hypothetical protein
MSLISTMEARLPPGFRFHPRDDELVLDYLCRKLSGGGGAAYSGIAMVDVDLNECEPWDLPGTCQVQLVLIGDNSSTSASAWRANCQAKVYVHFLISSHCQLVVYDRWFPFSKDAYVLV